MREMITEDIKRINELISLTEEDNIGNYIDSTYLKTSDQAGISDDETTRVIVKTIQDAMEHKMKLVMIRPEFVSLADQMIKEYDSDLLVGTVIGFPGDLDTVMKEVSEGTAIGIEDGLVVKWIIESAALNNQEITELTRLISKIVIETVGEQKARNVFVKTSTGFYKPEDGSTGGATIDAVSLMSQNAGPLKVKASGGIYSREDLEKMVDAGASRIGTSAGLEIIRGEKANTDY